MKSEVIAVEAGEEVKGRQVDRDSVALEVLRREEKWWERVKEWRVRGWRVGV